MEIGKFIFAWLFSQLEAGRKAEAMVEEAISMGLGMVAIKIADGAAVGGGSGTDEQIRFYVQALQKRGVQVWGWQYLYGGRRLVKDAAGKIIGTAENSFSTPEREAAVAIERVKAFGLDGYIADPEAQYKSAPAGRASRFISRLRAGLGAVPVGLCSYRYPLAHRELAWAELLLGTDYHMPQVYWGQGSRGDGLLNDGRFLSVVELNTSVAQLKALKDIPFLPVGRAYIGDGHANPRPAELAAFMARAKEMGFGGAGFWNWDCLRPAYAGGPGRKEAIRAFVYGDQPDTPGVTCPNCRTFIPLVSA